MKHAATRELYDYWQRLRGVRPAPDRTEIEPSDLRRSLGDTCILEVDARNESRFRLAGTRVCALYGRELKGKDFLSLWRGKDRDAVATLLAAVATRLLGKIRFGGLPWLSALPPILFNAVAIGGEWCYAMTGSINGAFWVFAGQIALGQLPPCLLGVWLVGLLERRSLQTIIEGK